MQSLWYVVWLRPWSSAWGGGGVVRWRECWAKTSSLRVWVWLYGFGQALSWPIAQALYKLEAIMCLLPSSQKVSHRFCWDEVSKEHCTSIIKVRGGDFLLWDRKWCNEGRLGPIGLVHLCGICMYLHTAYIHACFLSPLPVISENVIKSTNIYCLFYLRSM